MQPASRQTCDVKPTYTDYLVLIGAVKVLFTVRHQPGPNGVSSPPQSCISRLSHPVQVHVLPTSIDDGDTLLGEISLKTCIGTICVSRQVEYRYFGQGAF